MDEADFDQMSVKELRELKDRIDQAIRSQIMQQRVARNGIHDQSAPAMPAPIDLEAERDAWKARRK